ncbi:hypothetical protein EYF80_063147 [Liparis tanakae]|uniref:Uncharacterized protein n=1 Tax=Liparis tanakae TaxID=230148 RepID=A0A4Z2ED96_9TELE|nr:hypothetical protein EYF80_063147 [Liparis tanakae]
MTSSLRRVPFTLGVVLQAADALQQQCTLGKAVVYGHAHFLQTKTSYLLQQSAEVRGHLTQLVLHRRHAQSLRAPPREHLGDTAGSELLRLPDDVPLVTLVTGLTFDPGLTLALAAQRAAGGGHRAPPAAARPAGPAQQRWVAIVTSRTPAGRQRVKRDSRPIG